MASEEVVLLKEILSELKKLNTTQSDINRKTDRMVSNLDGIQRATMRIQ